MKNCPLCGSDNKDEAKACLHCSHPFGKEPQVATAPQVSTAPKPPKQRSAKKEKERPRRQAGAFGDHVILTPAGPPPCNPAHVGEQATDEEIEDWAYEVVEAGREQGKEYAPSAVKYFAHRFWGGSKDYGRACRAIDRALGRSGDTV